MTATTAILIVEDEKIIASGIEKQLKSMGYVVAGSASTGEEAVRKAVELRPDLILMDISLGKGIDGVEAADLIHEQMDVPVVYLTANSDDGTRRRAIATDPFGYVLKPYEDKGLQTAIEIGLYRHRMEWRLRENEQWLAATLGSIGDGVIATDERGRARFMNPLAERLTGWTQTDALGRDVREIFRIVEEGSRQPVPNPALDALEKRQTVGLAPDTILIDKSGAERPIDDSAAPIRGASGKVSGAVLVFRDISERRRLEDRLRQAEKMEAIRRLAGGIAHDFNNLMTVITGFSELLLDGTRSAAERHDFVRNISDAGKRATALTQQILAFSRRQILVPSVLDLNAVLRDMGAIVTQLIGSHIELAFEPAPDLDRVKADPTQIGQVILNLAANARDSMPKGGRLTFATMNAELGESVARQHPDVKPGRYAVLSVGDTGFGMADDVLAHIFEPFFTTKGVGKGTGLGLATMYGIVKQSGGHIEVTSRVGEGTTFRVYLPSVEEPLPTPKNEEIPPLRRGCETILLIEDEEAVRRLIKRVLQHGGYTVLEAANGLEAIAVAEKHPEPIHLLVTDLVMPYMPGWEVADRLKAARRGLRVLFVSGYTEHTSPIQRAEEAADDFMLKPFNLAALTNKVREILDRP